MTNRTVVFRLVMALGVAPLPLVLGCAEAGVGPESDPADAQGPTPVSLRLQFDVQNALPLDTVGFLTLEEYEDGQIDTVPNPRSVVIDTALAVHLPDGRLWIQKEGLLRVEAKSDTLRAVGTIRIHPFPLKSLLVRPGAVVAGRAGGRAELEVLGVTLRDDTVPAASIARLQAGLSSRTEVKGPWLFVRDLHAGESQLRVSVDQSLHPLLRGLPQVLSVDLLMSVGPPR